MTAPNANVGAKRHKDLSPLERAIVIEQMLTQYGAKNIGRGVSEKGIQIDSGTFLFLIGVPDQDDGFFVHVMADPVFTAIIAHDIWLHFTKLQCFGPFAKTKRGEDTVYVTGEEALKQKSALIMHAALVIRDEMMQSKAATEDGVLPASAAEETPAPEIIVPEEKKIILAS